MVIFWGVSRGYTLNRVSYTAITTIMSKNLKLLKLLSNNALITLKIS